MCPSLRHYVLYDEHSERGCAEHLKNVDFTVSPFLVIIGPCYAQNTGLLWENSQWVQDYKYIIPQGMVQKDEIAFAHVAILWYGSRDKDPSKWTVQQHIVQSKCIDARNYPNVPENAPSPKRDWFPGNKALDDE